MATRREKIWLILIAILYFIYNLPGVPAYGDSTGMFIHMACTVIPIWVIIYVGMTLVNSQYKINSDEEIAARAPKRGGDANA